MPRLLLAALFVPIVASAVWADSADGIDFFEKKIRPVLAEHCYACHSAAAEANRQLRADLRLDGRDGLLRGGDSGPALVPGDPARSLLIQSLRHDGPKMPKNKLPAAVIDDFVNWVKRGAPAPADWSTKQIRAADPQVTVNHWAFQPLRKTKVNAPTAHEIIDQLIAERQKTHDLKRAPAADRQTLIRRLSYDLTGLPPTMAEVEAFVNDAAPGAHEKLVDRLLASPHFGIHWARHWLDNVRYTDEDRAANGLAGGKMNMTFYRDWVVRALNSDLPYHDFVRLQVAGDLLPREDPRWSMADGLIASSVWALPAVVDDIEAEKVYAEFVDGQIDLLGRTFLGVTLACARCHDHKFDPISQADYYGLAGIFFSSHVLRDRNNRAGTPLVASAEELGRYESQQKRIQEIQAELQKLSRESSKEIEAARKTFRLPSAKDKLRAQPNSAASKNYSEAPASAAAYFRLEDEQVELQRAAAALPMIPALQEGGIPKSRHEAIGDMPLYIRGSHLNLGAVVPRHFPPALGGGMSPPAIQRGSGRRELAEWLTRPEHPLTARVMANRIWYYLVGEGIVRTPSNFGKLGESPVHPDVLDYLAARFMDKGWSIKSLIRDIVLSQTYQQTSLTSDEVVRADPENRLLTRMNRKRLTAEQLRDTLQEFTGKLQREVKADNLATSNRSLYKPVSRRREDAFATVFDGANPEELVSQRPDTTTAPQGLFLLNDGAMHEAVKAVAQQVLQARDDRGRVEKAYQLILRRQATAADIELALAIVEDLLKQKATGNRNGDSAAWTALCHALIGSNETLYVD